MIKINSLIKSFEEVKAVNNLTLTIENGVTGLVGHNGAGKSTLFRLIANIYKADSGTIEVNGIPHSSKEGKKQIFYLSDSPYVPSNCDCLGVFEFYTTFFDLDKDKFLRLLDKFGLPRLRKASRFSKGMRRQLFIIIALSSLCPILLLDEAFDGLDPLILEKIKTEIIELAGDNRTIVLSSHNISTLERLCDRFIILHKGQIGNEFESSDMGNTFNKYQALFKNEVTHDDLKKLGLDVITFNRIGSIYNFVILGDDDPREMVLPLDPTLLEPIPLNSTEIVALEMLLAKRKEEKK